MPILGLGFRRTGREQYSNGTRQSQLSLADGFLQVLTVIKNKVTRNQGQQEVSDAGKLNCEKKYIVSQKNGGAGIVVVVEIQKPCIRTHSRKYTLQITHRRGDRKKEQRSRVKWCCTQLFLLLIRCRHDSACVALSRQVLAYALCGR